MAMFRADLSDVNVWVAIADPSHTHHLRAKQYWERKAAETVGFCRITMLGLLRILTNTQSEKGRRLTTGEAWSAYRSFFAGSSGETVMLAEPPSFEHFYESLTDAPGFSPRLLTDASLAAWAMGSGARLVSFDGDFSRFPGLDWLHLTQ